MQIFRRLLFWRSGANEAHGVSEDRPGAADRFDRNLVVERYKNAKAYDDLRDALADMIRERNMRNKELDR
ncbi:hypothetical protein [Roseitranquillus sediminis]|uniref:hypothetical protein n=1 Tax=Roseitranquillus sediminis TaxID=2809051 RepID=UPI001D0C6665|nr:hypothetical protein [Roseitranquillus sediminis]MBM9594296.1 hypothetical protein [Roseitranquillus sediminis]